MTLSNDFYHVDVEIPLKSGIVKDYAHFGLNYIFLAGGPTATDFGHLVTRIQNFFRSTHTGQTLQVQAYMADTCATLPTTGRVRFYHLPTSPGPAGPPAFTGTWSMTSLAAGSEPAEVAVAFTLAADLTGIPEFGPGGTRPRSDRRNRFYLGPLDSGTKHSDATTKVVTVDSAFRTDVTKSYQAELFTGAIADGWSPQVLSRKLYTSVAPVTISADDQFDTIRRRRPASASRLTLTL